MLPVATLLVVLVAGALPTPYAIERPGPVFDVLGETEVEGEDVPLVSAPGQRVYAAEGDLDLLTVTVVGAPDGGPTWLDLAAAWLDPSQSVIPLEAVYPPGITSEQADEQSAAEFTDSQRSATAAALDHLGYEVGGTVTVADVEPTSAAAGVLEEGDVLAEFDGTAVTDTCGLQDLVARNGTADADVRVERDGETERLTVTPRRLEGSERPVIGILTEAEYDFPFEVELQLENVGGPSAGMMFALGIVDKLTPGSLTGGERVAGTGTICGDGRVGPIGGIVQKAFAAQREGATVLLVPAENCAELRGRAPDGLAVFSVRTLDGAVAAVQKAAEGRGPSGAERCV